MTPACSDADRSEGGKSVPTEREGHYALESEGDEVGEDEGGGAVDVGLVEYEMGDGCQAELFSNVQEGDYTERNVPLKELH
jgi:hypothetical protein